MHGDTVALPLYPTAQALVTENANILKSRLISVGVV
jgi:hypothetical protein